LRMEPSPLEKIELLEGTFPLMRKQNVQTCSLTTAEFLLRSVKVLWEMCQDGALNDEGEMRIVFEARMKE
jgi:hypothetical protein